MQKKTWTEFRKSGLLWWINRSLHLFGWAIVAETNEGEVVNVYPARVSFRGFDPFTEEQGFRKLTKHLEENLQSLLEATN